MADRSISRGREQQVFSSGRGGAGNIRPSSKSRDDASGRAEGGPGPDDYSQSRGRELPAQTHQKQTIVGSGRGGAGNIRSPSRGGAIEDRKALLEEAKYVREHANGDVPVSHGRGGAGNISNSRSRSRSRDPYATSPGNPAVLNAPSVVSTNTLGRLPEEGRGNEHHGHGNHGHSNSIGAKISNLFHRDHSSSRNSRDTRPEKPE